MHCPYCGQQPPTEQTRYCTQCGFALGPVKELLNTGTLPGATRQRDITLGAGLMLLGTIKAFLLAAAFARSRSGAIEMFALAEGAWLALLQLFFQLSPRQKGLSLGATLLFAGALAAFLAGVATEGFGAILVGIIAIPLILFWKRLSAGFLKLFFDKPESDAQRAVPQSRPAATLPSPQATPAVALPVAQAMAVDLDTDRMKQAAAFEPLSVVEGTTKTLGQEKLSQSSL
jgi:hypothetical protein